MWVSDRRGETGSGETWPRGLAVKSTPHQHLGIMQGRFLQVLEKVHAAGLQKQNLWVDREVCWRLHSTDVDLSMHQDSGVEETPVHPCVVSL